MSKTHPSPNDPSTRAGRVALVGRPNVGKSTLCNALLGETIAITSPHPQTTRDAVRGVLTTGRTQYVLVDTPGMHTPRTRLDKRMNAVALHEAREADALVLVTEAPRPTPGSSASTPRARADDLALLADLPDVPTVLVVGKVDRVANKSLLLPLIDDFAKARPFAATVPLSAKTRDGLDRLLDEIAVLLPEQPFLHDPQTLSEQPERFFVSELVREQVLRHARQEVPHGVAVVVEGFDEAAKPLRIDVTIHVAREAHTKILVGAQGRMLKAIGTAARLRIERLLGVRVNLQLRVRATPDWMNDEARLRDLGYGPPQVEDA